jgi:hypothetical protein
MKPDLSYIADFSPLPDDPITAVETSADAAQRIVTAWAAIDSHLLVEIVEKPVLQLVRPEK